MTENIPIVHVVEDDLSVGNALVRLFKSMGYKCEIFTSAEDFLKNTSKQGADCLLLDIKLPGMSGEDLFRELKNQGSDIPTIFITGHGDEDLEENVMNAGAHGYLEKPFDDQELINLIKTAIESMNNH